VDSSFLATANVNAGVTDRSADIDQNAQEGRALERMASHVAPGAWRIDNRGALATLLGSCVSVCLFDPVAQLGGLNHFMLPTCRKGTYAEDEIALAGDYAMQVLVNGLLARGAQKSRLVAKAFGGGNILSSIRTAIGDQNASYAREWLERERIPLVAHDLGGPWSRKVVFRPNTGDVYCKRIATTQSQAQDAIVAEVAYEKRLLRQQSPAKNVELF
jgi:chemotaxis protein CheD